MLILKTLALEPMHGYGIALRIEQISREVFRVKPGSLFPAFRRLERTGWIKPQWSPTENNQRAKYYSLTERGRRRSKVESDAWGKQIAAIYGHDQKTARQGSPTTCTRLVQPEQVV